MKTNIQKPSKFPTFNWPPSTSPATRSTATGTTRLYQAEKIPPAESHIDCFIYGQALRLSYSSIVKLPLVCVVAHESGVSSMDDCRNCQTATATPAEPGGLSWRLGLLLHAIVHPADIQDRDGGVLVM